MASRHWLYFGGFVVSVVSLVGVGLLGLLDALSALSGGAPSGEAPLLLVLLGAAAEWIVAGVAVGLLAAVFLAATVVSVLRNATIPRSDRLAAVVERLERRYPLLRRFDAAERVEPTAADRKRRLKERYVAGDLSDDEFEREMDALLDEEEGDGRRRSGGRSD